MKCYITENELRLVGKAWEVRAYLRNLVKKAAASATEKAPIACSLK